MSYWKSVNLTSKTKNVSLELLRIVACFWVIVNHTIEGITVSFVDGNDYFFAMLFYVMCRAAVPLFVMISGAVLIPKEEKLKDTLVRVLRMCIVLLCASLIYYGKYIMDMNASFSIKDFVYLIWTGNVTNAFWYMYLYIALLMMLPIFRIISKGSSREIVTLYLGLWIVTMGVIPLIQYQFGIAPMTAEFNLNMISGYSMFFILGDFFYNKIIKNEWIKEKKYAVGGILFYIVCSLCGTVFSYSCAKNGIPNYLYENRAFVTISIPSMVLFCSIVSLEIRNTSIKYALTLLGGLTFGTYLLSDLLIKLNWPIYEKMMIKHGSFVSMVVYEISVLILGMIITLIFKNILFMFKEIRTKMGRINLN